MSKTVQGNKIKVIFSLQQDKRLEEKVFSSNALSVLAKYQGRDESVRGHFNLSSFLLRCEGQNKREAISLPKLGMFSFSSTPTSWLEVTVR